MIYCENWFEILSFSFKKNTFQNVTCKILAILSRPQYINFRKWRKFAGGSHRFDNNHPTNGRRYYKYAQIAKFMGPTWGPPGSCRPQMGPILSTWTLLSGCIFIGFSHWLKEVRKWALIHPSQATFSSEVPESRLALSRRRRCVKCQHVITGPCHNEFIICHIAWCFVAHNITR